MKTDLLIYNDIFSYEYKTQAPEDSSNTFFHNVCLLKDIGSFKAGKKFYGCVYLPKINIIEFLENIHDTLGFKFEFNIVIKEASQEREFDLFTVERLFSYEFFCKNYCNNDVLDYLFFKITLKKDLGQYKAGHKFHECKYVKNKSYIELLENPTDLKSTRFRINIEVEEF